MNKKNQLKWKTECLSASQVAEQFPWIDPPVQQLYVRSHPGMPMDEIWTDLPYFGLAIVGTRQPSQRSVQLVHDVISHLAQANRNLIIVSGLAKGIDAEAHSAALDCGLRTVAVMANGIDAVYPPENENLSVEILNEAGLLVSEYPEKFPAKPFQFLARNRLIAGLSRAVWMVEAGVKSGARNTASWARRFNIDLYTTPTFPSDAHGEGNRILLQEGAYPVWNAQSFQSTWLRLKEASETSPPHKLDPWNAWHGLKIQAALQLSKQDASDFYTHLQIGIQTGLVQTKNGKIFAPHPATRLGDPYVSP